jgi:DNA polymerase I-like protein with 3'-5' exonuclease and polymerase domains
MIYFVTNKTEQYRALLMSSMKEFNDLRVVDEKQGIELYFNTISKNKVQSLDLETTGLDPFVSNIVLTGIGNLHTKFVFDYSIDLRPIYENMIRHRITLVGANLKFDIKFIQTNYNLLLTRVYDVIIAEQRLYMKFYQYNNLAELVQRYLKEYRNKTVRLEFVDTNVETFTIKYHHIKYLANDLDDPIKIRKFQKPKIKQFKMEFLIYGIEFPLISILADSENEGIDFDVEAWKAIITSNENKLFETQLKLDEELRRLRDFVSLHGNYKGLSPAITLGGLKYNKIRQKSQASFLINNDSTTNVLDIFGEQATIKSITNKKVYKVDPKMAPDYNSPLEIIKIFGRLGEPLPSKTGYLIPQFDAKGKLTLSVHNYVVSNVGFEKYLVDKPNSIMKDFILLLGDFSEYSTKLSNFGYNYLKKVNPVTNKLHTIYRQCHAVTGRMQSGGGKLEKDKFQSQNVPADPMYRACFIAPKGKKLRTSDYSGAELIVMASHAQDFKLISLSKIDMHSYMATLCWKAIYAARATKIKNQLTKMTSGLVQVLQIEYDKYVDLFKNFQVTKSDPPGFRKAFKGMTFGTIYGMYPKKAGETLNVPKEEGSIVIRTIEKELPDTFKMVKMASYAAVTQGYIINNYRTNSRAWFPMLIQQLKGNITKDTHFLEISKEESDARNMRIQGTQADFVKEASVVLGTYYRKRKLDAKILLWVHDEIVDKVNDNLLLKFNPNIDPKLLPNKFIKGKFYKDIAEAKNDIMVKVANKYLNNVTITADHETAQHWVK